MQNIYFSNNFKIMNGQWEAKKNQPVVKQGNCLCNHACIIFVLSNNIHNRLPSHALLYIVMLNPIYEKLGDL